MYKYIGKFFSFFYYVSFYWYYKLIFGHVGLRTRIYKPLRLENPQQIYIGNRVMIGKLCWLAATPHLKKVPKLIISDGCVIGNMNEFYSIDSIELEKNVLTADNVYIADNSHGYIDPSTPILKQKIIQLKQVRIGENSWIGRNVCILGASVGKHCVIGANSVVKKDIADYCIAVGNPAMVVKRYDLHSNIWRKTDKEGNFI